MKNHIRINKGTKNIYKGIDKYIICRYCRKTIWKCDDCINHHIDVYP